MDVEWDPGKARVNIRKHGISFSDAQTVLYDRLAISMEDRNAEGENRYLTVGSDALNRIVVVCCTYRNMKVRLISARRATKLERKAYEERIRFQ